MVLCFTSTNDLTGVGLVKHAIRLWFDFGLDINNLFGIGFDGGSNMSGFYKGAQVEIQKQYPLAIYMLYASHC